MKPIKTLIRIGVVLLILVTVVLVVRAVFNYVEGRALTRTLAELKKKGVPLAAGDLVPPCPDEDNGARLWKAAENLFTVKEKDSQSALAGAFLPYADGRPLAPEKKAALRTLAAENARVFEIMAEIGSKRCFLFRDPSTPIIEAFPPRAVKMVRATQLLGFEALFTAEGEDLPSGLAKIRMGLKFTPRVAEEGTLIAYLVAVADTRCLAWFLQAICRGRQISDDALVQLINDLDPSPWRERLAAAVRGERVGFVEAGERLLQGSLMESDSIFGEPSTLKGLGVWLARPVLKTDIRKSLPVYGVLEQQARLPYYESRARLRSLAGEHQARPWYAFFSEAMVANFESVFLKEAMLEATILTSRTGLACRLYRGRTGNYPESLEQLVPGILSEVPVDPFTSRPLAYKREGAGFVVYSFGSNEKDDGGRSTYNVTQLVMDKDDDFSWREPQ